MGLVIKSPAASFGPVGGKDAQHNVPAKTDTENNSLTHLFDLKDKPEKANVIFSFHGRIQDCKLMICFNDMRGCSQSFETFP